MRFCPICGKQGIKGDFCDDCKPSEANLDFKDIVASVCIHCNKYLASNKWTVAGDLEAAVIAVAKQRIKNPRNLPLTIEPLIENAEPKPGLDVDINIIVRVGDEEFNLPGKIKFTYCKRCGKKDSQYFEGILQLRDCSDDVTEFVENKLKKAESLGIFVTNRAPLKNGIDYFITDKRFLRRLGRDLKKNFKGELNESPQLFSRDPQRSKDIYRLNVLFRQR